MQMYILLPRDEINVFLPVACMCCPKKQELPVSQTLTTRSTFPRLCATLTTYTRRDTRLAHARVDLAAKCRSGPDLQTGKLI